MDDQAAGFSKRKYEKLNDRRRRMGDKKKQLKKNKVNARQAHEASKKAIRKTNKKWMDKQQTLHIELKLITVQFN